MSKTNSITLDIECYSNYFYALFKHFDSDHSYEVRLYNDVLEKGDQKTVKNMLSERQLFTFNGGAYDLIMLSAWLSGYDNQQLKDLSDELITSGRQPWQVARHATPQILMRKPRHIDMAGPTPLQASLKTYMCRIHAPTIKDLPLDPSETIDDEIVDEMEGYCLNDVAGTELIAKYMEPQLKLRAKMGNNYNMDMMSKSDPQIAEAIIKHELENAGVDVSKRTGEVEPFRYKAPQWLKFKDKTLREVLKLAQMVQMHVKKSGHVQLPKELEEVIEFAGAKYKMGIGGLHSQEKKQVVIPDDDHVYGEFDVASMYPSIILEQELYPQHIGEAFVPVYREMFDTRMEAKRSGDKVTADTLKIVLNSSYGKFGSKYSFLYGPELLVQTTLTGQLALLMLIERMTMAGFEVKSANTDGVNVLIPKARFDEAQAIADQWTEDTTYVLEWTPYEAQYSRDVNSYIALYDGGFKSKGAYEMDSIRKGYAHLACTNAILHHLIDGGSIEDDINHNTCVTDFLIMRGVKGGAVWRGEELGKVVRWYVSTAGEEITYKANGNKVAGSDGAVPMMTLRNELPADLDRQWYIDKAYKMLSELGVGEAPAAKRKNGTPPTPKVKHKKKSKPKRTPAATVGRVRKTGH